MHHREEDSSPENRELEALVRRLGGLLPGGPSVNWQESRPWCSEILGAVAAGCEKSRRLTAAWKDLSYEVGGDEHHLIRVEGDPSRIYKVTHGDNFGCRSYFSPFDPELTGRHFHGTGNADPIFYLRRWILLNSISAYQTRFEGFLPPQNPKWVPRICVSQAIVVERDPDQAEIRKALAEYGFTNISQDAFLHEPTALLLTDAAPRNVRIVEGIPVPFDAIASIASPDILEWVRGMRR